MECICFNILIGVEILSHCFDSLPLFIFETESGLIDPAAKTQARIGFPQPTSSFARGPHEFSSRPLSNTLAAASMAPANLKVQPHLQHHNPFPPAAVIRPKFTEFI